jgi:fluoride ion exporter CrcB/FEX
VNLLDVLLIALGGGIGATVRWAIGEILARVSTLPVWTGVLAANLAGCVIVGLASGAQSDDLWVHAWVITGLCGALTTHLGFMIRPPSPMLRTRQSCTWPFPARGTI